MVQPSWSCIIKNNYCIIIVIVPQKDLTVTIAHKISKETPWSFQKRKEKPCQPERIRFSDVQIQLTSILFLSPYQGPTLTTPYYSSPMRICTHGYEHINHLMQVIFPNLEEGKQSCAGVLSLMAIGASKSGRITKLNLQCKELQHLLFEFETSQELLLAEHLIHHLIRPRSLRSVIPIFNS